MRAFGLANVSVWWNSGMPQVYGDRSSVLMTLPDIALCISSLSCSSVSFITLCYITNWQMELLLVIGIWNWGQPYGTEPLTCGIWINSGSCQNWNDLRETQLGLEKVDVGGNPIQPVSEVLCVSSLNVVKEKQECFSLHVRAYIYSVTLHKKYNRL